MCLHLALLLLQMDNIFCWAGITTDTVQHWHDKLNSGTPHVLHLPLWTALVTATTDNLAHLH